MSEPVLCEIRDHVAWVTMNRPEALNALNHELTNALRAAVLPLEHEPAVRAVVIQGGEHFMAGGDLKWFHGMLDAPTEANLVRMEGFIDNVHGLIVAIRRMPKPVIASVRGAAAGFGLSLMMTCDLAIAADDAYFTLAYCLIGASPDGGSTYALPRLVGLRKAMELALLGDRFDARTALAYNIVNKVVPAAELAAETEKLARRLASGPTRVYGRTKALLQASLNNSLDSQLRLEAENFARSATEHDFAEGITAFVEKRRPEFTGE
jgi:2-(1,2-epoxy-1,2-dihydrophenyl)acetyl-CoA isomerase